MMQDLEEQLMDPGAALPARGTWTNRRRDQQEPHEAQQREMRSPAPGEKPATPGCAGWPESSAAENDLGISVGNKLAVSKQNTSR